MIRWKHGERPKPEPHAAETTRLCGVRVRPVRQTPGGSEPPLLGARGLVTAQRTEVRPEARTGRKMPR